MNLLQVMRIPFKYSRRVLFGCLLILIPVVNIVTVFLAAGYLVECVDYRLKRRHDMPQWTNWGLLFLKGLFALLICAAYLLPGLVLATLVGGWAWIVFAIGLFVLPAALLEFVFTEEVKAGLSVQVIRRVFSFQYLIGLFGSVVMTGLVMGVSVSISILSAKTVVLPVLLIPMALFWSAILCSGLLGHAYRELIKHTTSD